jgi:hypothetical protein
VLLPRSRQAAGSRHLGYSRFSGILAALFVGVLVAMLPDVPWDVLQYGGPALMIIFPIFFYPFSKTIFLAFDLFFRPPTRQDFP